MNQRWIQTREDEMYATGTRRFGSLMSYEQCYEPCFLGLDQYSGPRNRSNFYQPDYELKGMGQRWNQSREDEMYAIGTRRLDSFVNYKQCYGPYSFGLYQHSGSRNRLNFYPPDYILGGCYTVPEPITTFKNPVSNVYDEKKMQYDIYNDNAQKNKVPSWIRDELKKKRSKNRNEHELTTNEQNYRNFNNEKISQIFPHLLNKSNDRENQLINEKLKNKGFDNNNEAELTKSKFKKKYSSISHKNMESYQKLIVSKMLMECTKDIFLKTIKKVLKATAPRESRVMDTRDRRSQISLIDQLGIRAYCSESDSSDENDSEHQATTPSHELALQRDPDKTIHDIILKKRTTLYKTKKKVKRQLDQTEDRQKEYSHSGTFRVSRKSRSRSRSPTSHSRSKKNRSHSKKGVGLYSKHHEKSNDYRSRSKHC